MISTSDIKKGVTFKMDGDLFQVIDFLHVKPGKGGAFVRTKLRNIKKGTVVERTFRSGEKFDDIRLEKREMQYLYQEGDSLVFMDTENYEQISISKDAVGDALLYIQENDNVNITIYEEEPISIELPPSVVLKVTYAEPGIRGDTATNVLKPVKVETGAEIKVPIFVNEGDYIKINTDNGEYLERVKN
jgi:elongation factor P